MRIDDRFTLHLIAVLRFWICLRFHRYVAITIYGIWHASPAIAQTDSLARRRIQYMTQPPHDKPISVILYTKTSALPPLLIPKLSANYPVVFGKRKLPARWR